LGAVRSGDEQNFITQVNNPRLSDAKKGDILSIEGNFYVVFEDSEPDPGGMANIWVKRIHLDGSIEAGKPFFAGSGMSRLRVLDWDKIQGYDDRIAREAGDRYAELTSSPLGALIAEVVPLLRARSNGDDLGHREQELFGEIDAHFDGIDSETDVSLFTDQIPESEVSRLKMGDIVWMHNKPELVHMGVFNGIFVPAANVRDSRATGKLKAVSHIGGPYDVVNLDKLREFHLRRLDDGSAPAPTPRQTPPQTPPVGTSGLVTGDLRWSLKGVDLPGKGIVTDWVRTNLLEKIDSIGTQFGPTWAGWAKFFVTVAITGDDELYRAMLGHLRDAYRIEENREGWMPEVLLGIAIHEGASDTYREVLRDAAEEAENTGVIHRRSTEWVTGVELYSHIALAAAIARDRPTYEKYRDDVLRIVRSGFDTDDTAENTTPIIGNMAAIGRTAIAISMMEGSTEAYRGILNRAKEINEATRFNDQLHRVETVRNSFEMQFGFLAVAAANVGGTDTNYDSFLFHATNSTGGSERKAMALWALALSGDTERLEYEKHLRDIGNFFRAPRIQGNEAYAAAFVLLAEATRQAKLVSGALRESKRPGAKTPWIALSDHPGFDEDKAEFLFGDEEMSVMRDSDAGGTTHSWGLSYVHRDSDWTQRAEHLGVLVSVNKDHYQGSLNKTHKNIRKPRFDEKAGTSVVFRPALTILPRDVNETYMREDGSETLIRMKPERFPVYAEFFAELKTGLEAEGLPVDIGENSVAIHSRYFTITFDFRGEQGPPREAPAVPAPQSPAPPSLVSDFEVRRDRVMAAINALLPELPAKLGDEALEQLHAVQADLRVLVGGFDASEYTDEIPADDTGNFSPGDIVIGEKRAWFLTAHSSTQRVQVDIDRSVETERLNNISISHVTSAGPGVIKKLNWEKLKALQLERTSASAEDGFQAAPAPQAAALTDDSIAGRINALARELAEVVPRLPEMGNREPLLEADRDALIRLKEELEDLTDGFGPADYVESVPSNSTDLKRGDVLPNDFRDFGGITFDLFNNNQGGTSSRLIWDDTIRYNESYGSAGAMDVRDVGATERIDWERLKYLHAWRDALMRGALDGEDYFNPVPPVRDVRRLRDMLENSILDVVRPDGEGGELKEKTHARGAYGRGSRYSSNIDGVPVGVESLEVKGDDGASQSVLEFITRRREETPFTLRTTHDYFTVDWATGGVWTNLPKLAESVGGRYGRGRDLAAPFVSFEGYQGVTTNVEPRENGTVHITLHYSSSNRITDELKSFAPDQGYADQALRTFLANGYDFTGRGGRKYEVRFLFYDGGAESAPPAREPTLGPSELDERKSAIDQAMPKVIEDAPRQGQGVPLKADFQAALAIVHENLIALTRGLDFNDYTDEVDMSRTDSYRYGDIFVSGAEEFDIHTEAWPDSQRSQMTRNIIVGKSLEMETAHIMTYSQRAGAFKARRINWEKLSALQGQRAPEPEPPVYRSRVAEQIGGVDPGHEILGDLSKHDAREFLAGALDLAQAGKFSQLRGYVYRFFAPEGPDDTYETADQFLDLVGYEITPAVRSKRALAAIRDDLNANEKVNTEDDRKFAVRVGAFENMLRRLGAPAMVMDDRNRGRSYRPNLYQLGLHEDGELAEIDGTPSIPLEEFPLLDGRLTLDGLLTEDNLTIRLPSGPPITFSLVDGPTWRLGMHDGTTHYGIEFEETDRERDAGPMLRISLVHLVDFKEEDGVFRLYVSEELYSRLPADFPKAGYFEAEGDEVTFEILPARVPEARQGPALGDARGQESLESLAGSIATAAAEGRDLTGVELAQMYEDLMRLTRDLDPVDFVNFTAPADISKGNLVWDMGLHKPQLFITAYSNVSSNYTGIMFEGSHGGATRLFTQESQFHGRRQPVVNWLALRDLLSVPAAPAPAIIGGDRDVSIEVHPPPQRRRHIDEYFRGLVRAVSRVLKDPIADTVIEDRNTVEPFSQVPFQATAWILPVLDMIGFDYSSDHDNFTWNVSRAPFDNRRDVRTFLRNLAAAVEDVDEQIVGDRNRTITNTAQIAPLREFLEPYRTRLPWDRVVELFQNVFGVESREDAVLLLGWGGGAEGGGGADSGDERPSFNSLSDNFWAFLAGRGEIPRLFNDFRAIANEMIAFEADAQSELSYEEIEEIVLQMSPPNDGPYRYTVALPSRDDYIAQARIIFTEVLGARGPRSAQRSELRPGAARSELRVAELPPESEVSDQFPARVKEPGFAFEIHLLDNKPHAYYNLQFKAGLQYIQLRVLQPFKAAASDVRYFGLHESAEPIDYAPRGDITPSDENIFSSFERIEASDLGRGVRFTVERSFAGVERLINILTGMGLAPDESGTYRGRFYDHETDSAEGIPFEITVPVDQGAEASAEPGAPLTGPAASSIEDVMQLLTTRGRFVEAPDSKPAVRRLRNDLGSELVFFGFGGRNNLSLTKEWGPEDEEFKFTVTLQSALGAGEVVNADVSAAKTVRVGDDDQPISTPKLKLKGFQGIEVDPRDGITYEYHFDEVEIGDEARFRQRFLAQGLQTVHPEAFLQMKEMLLGWEAPSGERFRLVIGNMEKVRELMGLPALPAEDTAAPDSSAELTGDVRVIVHRADGEDITPLVGRLFDAVPALREEAGYKFSPGSAQNFMLDLPGIKLVTGSNPGVDDFTLDDGVPLNLDTLKWKISQAEVNAVSLETKDGKQRYTFYLNIGTSQDYTRAINVLGPAMETMVADRWDNTPGLRERHNDIVDQAKKRFDLEDNHFVLKGTEPGTEIRFIFNEAPAELSLAPEIERNVLDSRELIEVVFGDILQGFDDIETFGDMYASRWGEFSTQAYDVFQDWLIKGQNISGMLSAAETEAEQAEYAYTLLLHLAGFGEGPSFAYLNRGNLNDQLDRAGITQDVQRRAFRMLVDYYEESKGKIASSGLLDRLNPDEAEAAPAVVTDPSLAADRHVVVKRDRDDDLRVVTREVLDQFPDLWSPISVHRFSNVAGSDGSGGFLYTPGPDDDNLNLIIPGIQLKIWEGDDGVSRQQDASLLTDNNEGVKTVTWQIQQSSITGVGLRVKEGRQIVELYVDPTAVDSTAYAFFAINYGDAQTRVRPREAVAAALFARGGGDLANFDRINRMIEQIAGRVEHSDDRIIIKGDELGHEVHLIGTPPPETATGRGAPGLANDAEKAERILAQLAVIRANDPVFEGLSTGISGFITDLRTKVAAYKWFEAILATHEFFSVANYPARQSTQFMVKVGLIAGGGKLADSNVAAVRSLLAEALPADAIVTGVELEDISRENADDDEKTVIVKIRTTDPSHPAWHVRESEESPSIKILVGLAEIFGHRPDDTDALWLQLEGPEITESGDLNENHPHYARARAILNAESLAFFKKHYWELRRAMGIVIFNDDRGWVEFKQGGILIGNSLNIGGAADWERQIIFELASATDFGIHRDDVQDIYYEAGARILHVAIDDALYARMQSYEQEDQFDLDQVPPETDLIFGTHFQVKPEEAYQVRFERASEWQRPGVLREPLDPDLRDRTLSKQGEIEELVAELREITADLQDNVPRYNRRWPQFTNEAYEKFMEWVASLVARVKRFEEQSSDDDRASLVLRAIDYLGDIVRDDAWHFVFLAEGNWDERLDAAGVTKAVDRAAVMETVEAYAAAKKAVTESGLLELPEAGQTQPEPLAEEPSPTLSGDRDQEVLDRLETYRELVKSISEGFSEHVEVRRSTFSEKWADFDSAQGHFANWLVSVQTSGEFAASAAYTKPEQAEHLRWGIKSLARVLDPHYSRFAILHGTQWGRDLRRQGITGADRTAFLKAVEYFNSVILAIEDSGLVDQLETGRSETEPSVTPDRSAAAVALGTSGPAAIVHRRPQDDIASMFALLLAQFPDTWVRDESAGVPTYFVRDHPDEYRVVLEADNKFSFEMPGLTLTSGTEFNYTGYQLSGDGLHLDRLLWGIPENHIKAIQMTLVDGLPRLRIYSVVTHMSDYTVTAGMFSQSIESDLITDDYAPPRDEWGPLVDEFRARGIRSVDGNFGGTLERWGFELKGSNPDESIEFAFSLPPSLASLPATQMRQILEREEEIKALYKRIYPGDAEFLNLEMFYRQKWPEFTDSAWQGLNDWVTALYRRLDRGPEDMTDMDRALNLHRVLQIMGLILQDSESPTPEDREITDNLASLRRSRDAWGPAFEAAGITSEVDQAVFMKTVDFAENARNEVRASGLLDLIQPRPPTGGGARTLGPAHKVLERNTGENLVEVMARLLRSFPQLWRQNPGTPTPDSGHLLYQYSDALGRNGFSFEPNTMDRFIHHVPGIALHASTGVGFPGDASSVTIRSDEPKIDAIAWYVREADVRGVGLRTEEDSQILELYIDPQWASEYIEAYSAVTLREKAERAMRVLAKSHNIPGLIPDLIAEFLYRIKRDGSTIILRGREEGTEVHLIISSPHAATPEASAQEPPPAPAPEPPAMGSALGKSLGFDLDREEEVHFTHPDGSAVTLGGFGNTFFEPIAGTNRAVVGRREAQELFLVDLETGRELMRVDLAAAIAALSAASDDRGIFLDIFQGTDNSGRPYIGVDTGKTGKALIFAVGENTLLPAAQFGPSGVLDLSAANDEWRVHGMYVDPESGEWRFIAGESVGFDFDHGDYWKVGAVDSDGNMMREFKSGLLRAFLDLPDVKHYDGHLYLADQYLQVHSDADETDAGLISKADGLFVGHHLAIDAAGRVLGDPGWSGTSEIYPPLARLQALKRDGETGKTRFIDSNLHEGRLAIAKLDRMRYHRGFMWFTGDDGKIYRIPYNSGVARAADHTEPQALGTVTSLQDAFRQAFSKQEGWSKQPAEESYRRIRTYGVPDGTGETNYRLRVRENGSLFLELPLIELDFSDEGEVQIAPNDLEGVLRTYGTGFSFVFSITNRDIRALKLDRQDGNEILTLYMDPEEKFLTYAAAFSAKSDWDFDSKNNRHPKHVVVGDGEIVIRNASRVDERTGISDEVRLVFTNPEPGTDVTYIRRKESDDAAPDLGGLREQIVDPKSDSMRIFNAIKASGGWEEELPGRIRFITDDERAGRGVGVMVAEHEPDDNGLFDFGGALRGDTRYSFHISKISGGNWNFEVDSGVIDSQVVLRGYFQGYAGFDIEGNVPGGRTYVFYFDALNMRGIGGDGVHPVARTENAWVRNAVLEGRFEIGEKYRIVVRNDTEVRRNLNLPPREPPAFNPPTASDLMRRLGAVPALGSPSARGRRRTKVSAGVLGWIRTKIGGPARAVGRLFARAYGGDPREQFRNQEIVLNVANLRAELQRIGIDEPETQAVAVLDAYLRMLFFEAETTSDATGGRVIKYRPSDSTMFDRLSLPRFASHTDFLNRTNEIISLLADVSQRFEGRDFTPDGVFLAFNDGDINLRNADVTYLVKLMSLVLGYDTEDPMLWENLQRYDTILSLARDWEFRPQYYESRELEELLTAEAGLTTDDAVRVIRKVQLSATAPGDPLGRDPFSALEIAAFVRFLAKSSGNTPRLAVRPASEAALNALISEVVGEVVGPPGASRDSRSRSELRDGEFPINLMDVAARFASRARSELRAGQLPPESADVPGRFPARFRVAGFAYELHLINNRPHEYFNLQFKAGETYTQFRVSQPFRASASDTSEFRFQAGDEPLSLEPIADSEDAAVPVFTKFERKNPTDLSRGIRLEANAAFPRVGELIQILRDMGIEPDAEGVYAGRFYDHESDTAEGIPFEILIPLEADPAADLDSTGLAPDPAHPELDEVIEAFNVWVRSTVDRSLGMGFAALREGEEEVEFAGSPMYRIYADPRRHTPDSLLRYLVEKQLGLMDAAQRGARTIESSTAEIRDVLMAMRSDGAVLAASAVTDAVKDAVKSWLDANGDLFLSLRHLGDLPPGDPVDPEFPDADRPVLHTDHATIDFQVVADNMQPDNVIPSASMWTAASAVIGGTRKTTGAYYGITVNYKAGTSIDEFLDRVSNFLDHLEMHSVLPAERQKDAAQIRREIEALIAGAGGESAGLSLSVPSEAVLEAREKLENLPILAFFERYHEEFEKGLGKYNISEREVTASSAGVGFWTFYYGAALVRRYFHAALSINGRTFRNESFSILPDNILNIQYEDDPLVEEEPFTFHITLNDAEFDVLTQQLARKGIDSRIRHELSGAADLTRFVHFWAESDAARPMREEVLPEVLTDAYILNRVRERIEGAEIRAFLERNLAELRKAWEVQSIRIADKVIGFQNRATTSAITTVAIASRPDGAKFVARLRLSEISTQEISLNLSNIQGVSYDRETMTVALDAAGYSELLSRSYGSLNLKEPVRLRVEDVPDEVQYIHFVEEGRSQAEPAAPDPGTLPLLLAGKTWVPMDKIREPGVMKSDDVDEVAPNDTALWYSIYSDAGKLEDGTKVSRTDQIRFGQPRLDQHFFYSLWFANPLISLSGEFVIDSDKDHKASNSTRLNRTNSWYIAINEDHIKGAYASNDGLEGLLVMQPDSFTEVSALFQKAKDDTEALTGFAINIDDAGGTISVGTLAFKITLVFGEGAGKAQTVVEQPFRWIPYAAVRESTLDDFAQAASQEVKGDHYVIREYSRHSDKITFLGHKYGGPERNMPAGTDTLDVRYSEAGRIGDFGIMRKEVSGTSAGALSVVGWNRYRRPALVKNRFHDNTYNVQLPAEIIQEAHVASNGLSVRLHLKAKSFGTVATVFRKAKQKLPFLDIEIDTESKRIRFANHTQEVWLYFKNVDKAIVPAPKPKPTTGIIIGKLYTT
ncbi:MAG: hypothetical protein Q8R76_06235, partial [Candidatus Omnitrophota bacterium]|nr:hypothetical protein [Candidatus Omnitrophota bacterium]